MTSLAAALRDAVFACNDSLNLTPALVALKDADFQILDRMGRPSNQMCIAAALVTAKRFNKFLLLHKYGMIFHTSPCPNVAGLTRLSLSASSASCKGNAE